jgi:hypothetical protein
MGNVTSTHHSSLATSSNRFDFSQVEPAAMNIGYP